MISLSKYREDLITRLFDQLGCFFAFSNEQFNKSRKQGVTYVRFDGGLFCPEENEVEFSNVFNKEMDDSLDRYVKEYDAIDIMKYELHNHEYGYTYDDSDTRDYLYDFFVKYPDKFNNDTFEIAKRQARKEYELHN